MNFGLPNQAPERTGLSLWVWPWGFWFAHVRTPVAQLVRHESATLGILNRRQRRETYLTLCFLGYLLLLKLGFFDRGPRGIRGFFSCVWSVSWVQFPNAWIGRPSRRVGRCWPEIFESMNLGLPNQIAAPNRRLPLGQVPWRFAALTSQGSAVGELNR